MLLKTALNSSRYMLFSEQNANLLKAGIIPSMAVIVITGTTILNRFSNEAAESTTTARSVAEGAIHAVQVVQAFDAFDPLITEHESHLTQAMKSGTKKSIASAMLLGSVFFIALVILQELVKNSFKTNLA